MQKKKNLNPYPTKMDCRPKYKSESIKILEEKTGESVCDLGLGRVLSYHTKAWS